MLDEIIAIVGTVLVFLDLILGYAVATYRRFLLLSFGALLIGIAVILVTAGVGTGALS